MAITLQLRADVEARLVGQAKANGLPVAAYVENLIEELAVTAGEQYPRVGIRDSLMRLAKQWHGLPTLDERNTDAILEYGDFGLPMR